jgi:hypothetical protein
MVLNDDSLTENDIRLYLCRENNLKSVLKLNKITNSYVEEDMLDNLEIEEQEIAEEQRKASKVAANRVASNGDAIIIEKLFSDSANLSAGSEQSLNRNNELWKDEMNVLIEYQRCYDYFLKISIRNKFDPEVFFLVYPIFINKCRKKSFASGLILKNL